MSMTKREMAITIAEKLDLTQAQVSDAIQMTLDMIAKELADGNKVELRNFGVFEVRTRKARVGRNPNQPDVDILIPECKIIKFRAGKILKDTLTVVKKPKKTTK